MDAYRSRVADAVLEDSLEALGAVVVQGTKWCGKTTTAAHHAKSVLYMDDPETMAQNLQMAETHPSRLLEGATPRLIDEWELAPPLWDAARFAVDHRDNHVGQFIFTGSAVPQEKKLRLIHHSGTGRFDWITMRPMSLWESGESTGDVSLGDLFSGKRADGASPSDIDQMAYLLCRGGWPGALSMSEKSALHVSSAYLKAVVNSDISRVDDVARDPDLMRRILRSLARHQGGQVPVTTIYEDLRNNSKASMSVDTLEDYIKILKKIFLEEDAPAWNPNLRSRTAIRTSDTRYFVDPSIATAALGMGPKDLLDDLSTFGLFFETMAIRDLRVYADALGGGVSHYRDKNGLECDAVVHLPNGKYGLVEVKLGGETLIESGVASLKKLASKIDTDAMREPSFLMVLTATGNYAYQRTDGVSVVPIRCLKN